MRKLSYILIGSALAAASAILLTKPFSSPTRASVADAKTISIEEIHRGIDLQALPVQGVHEAY